jgi:hypothetical protein
VDLVGQKKAVGMVVRGGQIKRRWTKLKDWQVSHQGCARKRNPFRRCGDEPVQLELVYTGCVRLAF